MSVLGIQFGVDNFGWICFGTVISNLLVFYLIEYLGAGFSITCSYFGNGEGEEVGYLYQKTLGISFLLCVAMTPLLYISDRFLYLLGFGKDIKT